MKTWILQYNEKEYETQLFDTKFEVRGGTREALAIKGQEQNERNRHMMAKTRRMCQSGPQLRIAKPPKIRNPLHPPAACSAFKAAARDAEVQNSPGAGEVQGSTQVIAKSRCVRSTV
jgi:hypothetical protein